MRNDGVKERCKMFGFLTDLVGFHNRMTESYQTFFKLFQHSQFSVISVENDMF